jgi:2-oxo-4-hydroxy-4-carboxy-5-ureidoimidazoline decarboxylase
MTLDDLNRADRDTFVAALGGIFEHSPWVAEAAWPARPFQSIPDLHASMVAAVQAAGEARQLALIRAHPELAGKAALSGAVTRASAAEQSGAGLGHCSPDELAQLRALNERYRATFGFPFVLAVKGRDRRSIIATMARRVGNDAASERAECLRQIARIAAQRLDALIAA